MEYHHALGMDNFETLIDEQIFYIDKTDFIREWWNNKSKVTLIARPRRFGKTLNMSMLECFFSHRFKERKDLFEGLSIGQDQEMMELQGTFPVIFLSFASLKSDTYKGFKIQLLGLLEKLYDKNPEVGKPVFFADANEQISECIKHGLVADINGDILCSVISDLSHKMYIHYGKKVIILIDEYDTPMQEAYMQGYWDAMMAFIRPMFNGIFKSNDALYRAVVTGITRVGKESIFSDFNNPDIITTTSNEYAASFGFTEEEVFGALDHQGLSDQKELVKTWYDGFKFGKVNDIYNPWSIINFLKKQEVGTYWANTSSNGLIGTLVMQGTPEVKKIMEDLLAGIPLVAEIDEQIVFHQLDSNENAIWSLLLASGYLHVDEHHIDEDGVDVYTLSLTNLEVRLMFEKMVKGWFKEHVSGDYNGLIKALLEDDLESMNHYMNRVALSTFSNFDTGRHPSWPSEPERFYHGFVLGLLVDLKKDYHVLSNRESGFGRYDIMLEPLRDELPAIVIEFKVYNQKKEKSLEDTVAAAHAQIEQMKYDQTLFDKGIAPGRIFHYGFAFEGKKVLIG